MKKEVMASEQLEDLAVKEEKVKKEEKPVLSDTSSTQVRLNMTFDAYIGGKFYAFSSGKVYTVPKTVHFALQRRGALAAL